MKFQLFLAVALLFETYQSCGASNNAERVALAVLKHLPYVFQHYFLRKNETSPNEWEKGVDECIRGCAQVLDGFPGPTYDNGKTVITSFKIHTDKLEMLTKSNSTIMPSRSTAMLKAISLLSKLGISSNYLLYQLAKALPKMSSAYRQIVTDLSDHIGYLTVPINEVITKIENSTIATIKQFQDRFIETKLKRSEKIDFTTGVKNAQLLINIIALIAETALNDCRCVTLSNDVYESIAVLPLILNHYLIAIQGTHANIGSVIYSESESIPDSLEPSLKSLDPLINGIAESVTSITDDVPQSTREFLTSFVDLTQSSNKLMDDLGFGSFPGCNITVAQVKKNLLRSKIN